MPVMSFFSPHPVPVEASAWGTLCMSSPACLLRARWGDATGSLSYLKPRAGASGSGPGSAALPSGALAPFSSPGERSCPRVSPS